MADLVAQSVTLSGRFGELAVECLAGGDQSARQRANDLADAVGEKLARPVPGGGARNDDGLDDAIHRTAPLPATD